MMGIMIPLETRGMGDVLGRVFDGKFEFTAHQPVDAYVRANINVRH